ncbi:MAG: hypothetical protein V1818_02405 [Candidatus Aenigmatarchaeota archaeon]
MFDLDNTGKVQDQTALMTKEERVGRIDECCRNTGVNAPAGPVYRRWDMPSTQIILLCVQAFN